MSAAPLKNYPQPGETGKLLVVVNKNNNNNAALRAASAISFASGSGLSEAEREHLAQLLLYHPHGQAVADELAGQLRARGRGPAGIRNPRALAMRLAREATAHGVGLWYYWQEESERRAMQNLHSTEAEAAKPATASKETIAKAKAEMQAIRARQAAARLAGGSQ